jgi:hypothetical protein
MFPIFTDPDEQRIGVAVEPISGKMVFVAETWSNSTHFGGRVHSTQDVSIG